MSKFMLLSTDAKRMSVAVAILSAVTQVLFVSSLFGGFHGTIA